MKIRYRFLLYVLVSVFYIYLPVVVKAESNIVISSLSSARSSSPLLDYGGIAYMHYNPSQWTLYAYGALNNLASGENECNTIFYSPQDEINNFLVNENGNNKVDVFFITPTQIQFNNSELIEIEKFIKNGGILFISSDSTAGLEVVPNQLLEYLGIQDRFGNSYFASSNTISSPPENTTKIVNGVFGIIPYIYHGYHRSIDAVESVPVFRNVSNNNALILSELSYGDGYIVLSGDPIYVNALAKAQNLKYLRNMAALACDYNNPPDPWEGAVVLPVDTHFKQTDSQWADMEYDDATKQILNCGENIRECGCAMTSVANLLKYWGVDLDPFQNDVNPIYLNIYLKQKPFENLIGDINYFTSWGFYKGGVLWDQISLFSAISARDNPGQLKLDLSDIKKYFDLDLIKTEIDEGRPVLLKVVNNFGGDHWVMVFGYLENELIVSDPVTTEPLEGFNTLTSLGYTPAKSNVNQNVMIFYKEANTDYSFINVASIAPAKTIITNELGQKAGFENEVINEINNSNYYFDGAYADFLKEKYPEVGDGNYINSIHTPSKGIYKINLSEDPEDFCQYTIYASNKDAVSNYVTINDCDESEIYFDPESDEIFWQEEAIDIKPHNDKNFINIKSEEEFQVGVLSRNEFDATKLDFESISLNGINPIKKIFKRDINGDKRNDAILHFKISELENYDNSDLCLFGSVGDYNFYGCDEVILYK